MALDLTTHPCFNKEAKSKYGRIHLPVAPVCNIQCNFCNRKFDCVNESRPGVTSSILTPYQALEYMKIMKGKHPELSVVGIAGPGDPFANPKEVLKTFDLIRENFPEMLLCVSTNGLFASKYIDELKKCNLSHLTVTINAVDPEIGAGIYSWIRYEKRVYRGLQAATLLLEKQIETVKLAKEAGLTVKVNTILMPGINDKHVPEVAKKLSEYGVDIFNCMPLCSVPNTLFESVPEPEAELVASVRLQAGQYIKQMTHCARCRADAVGCLGKGTPDYAAELMRNLENGPINPTQKRPYVATVSREGLLVNMHLGEAVEAIVYDYVDGKLELIDTRTLPDSGGADNRWIELANTLSDCRALLVQDAGPKPMKIISEHGIKVVRMEGLIDQGVMDVFDGREIKCTSGFKCGSSCFGDGMGCG